jgi:hypothetical protein
VKSVPEGTREVYIEAKKGQIIQFKFDPRATDLTHLHSDPAVGVSDLAVTDKGSEGRNVGRVIMKHGSEDFTNSGHDHDNGGPRNAFVDGKPNNYKSEIKQNNSIHTNRQQLEETKVAQSESTMRQADASKSTSSCSLKILKIGESYSIDHWSPEDKRSENKLVTEDGSQTKPSVRENITYEKNGDFRSKGRDNEHSKKKKKSKRKKSLERQALDASDSESWHSLPGTEPLVVTLRKDVRTGEEIPGTDGKIAEISLYSVVKHGNEAMKTDAGNRQRPRFEHRKITRPDFVDTDELEPDPDKVNATSTSRNDHLTPPPSNLVHGTEESEVTCSECFQDLLPWQLKFLNELSPDRSELDHQDGFIYESIGCDDICMEWSPNDCEQDIAESISDIFVAEPHESVLVVRGKNIFRRVESEDRPSPENGRMTPSEKPSPYSLETKDEAYSCVAHSQELAGECFPFSLSCSIIDSDFNFKIESQSSKDMFDL